MRVTMFCRGRTWWAQSKNNGHRVRRSLKTTNKRIAEDLARELEREIHNGVPPKKEPERVSITVFRDEYESYCEANKRPKTAQSDKLRVKEFIAHSGVESLDQVTTASVSRFLSHKVLKDKIAPATVLRYREILHAMMEHAIRLEHVTENPVAKIPRPRLPDREPRCLSPKQIKELLRAVKGDRLYPLVATAVFAGLRRKNDVRMIGQGSLERRNAHAFAGHVVWTSP